MDIPAVAVVARQLSGRAQDVFAVHADYRSRS